jgi:ketosteroid isomerase-like protein
VTPIDCLREYEGATRAHDLARTLALIGDDAVYWFSDGTTHVGKLAIERALRTNFELIEGEEYRISEVVWLAQSADIAACTYWYDWSGRIRGTPASGSGRGTCLLVRRGNAWVVVHEHLSKGKAGAGGS